MHDEEDSSGKRNPGQDKTIGIDPPTASPIPLPRIAHYRVLSVIGEGGMGTVYEAEQENPRRRVALKVIKAGMASGSALKRFETESQVLGRLQHPGIAQIYEAGTANTGFGPQPYFAMEFVQGITLGDKLIRGEPDLRETLELMARVADAVHHAHQRGIIHRDLKPGNILVDEAGKPKVLDFGVARATDSDIQATMQTSLGEVIGTVPYMSPEQILADPLELDTRTDVYSLGVILYEALTGRLPHDFDQKTLVEAARMISEEDPAPAGTLNRACRGDVETIVGKAMEKDKNRRYGTAADLAADIRRYLRDEPILAQPPTTVYQLQKFAKRNKPLVGGVAAVFIVLVAGVVVSAAQARIARREAAKARAVNVFLNNMLGSANPMMLSASDSLKGRGVTVVEVLDDAADRLRHGDLSDQPLVDAAVSQTLGDTYRQLGERASAEPLLERSLEMRRTHLGEDRLETAESLNSLGALRLSQSEFAEAERLFREAEAIRRRHLGDMHPDVATTLHNLAEALQVEGKPEEAEPLYVEALHIRENSLGENDPQTAETLNELATLYREQGNPEKAETYFEKALEIRRRALGDRHPQVGRTLHDLAFVYEDEGRLAEAEAARRESVSILREALGNDHPFLSASLVNLGTVLKDEGRLAEAEPLYLEALAIQRKNLPENDPDIGAALYNLAKLYQAQGKLKEAERHSREALAILEQSLPEGHPTLAGVRSGLGSVLTDLGRPQEAEPLLRNALDIYEESFPGTWYADQVRSLLGAAVLGQGRYSEAESLLLSSQAVLEEDPGVSADRKRQAIERIVRLYENWDRAAPGTGKAETAREWRGRLAADS